MYIRIRVPSLSPIPHPAGPHVVSLLQDTKLWIIMEYLGGGSALDLVSADNPPFPARLGLRFSPSSPLVPQASSFHHHVAAAMASPPLQPRGC